MILTSLNILLRRKKVFGVLSAVWQIVHNQGVIGLFREYWKFTKINHCYAIWVDRFDTLRDDDLKAISEHVASFSAHPLISILMPTHNTTEKWLRRAIDSVRAQVYPNWELCIADDASSVPHVRTILDEYARLDGRIRVVFRGGNGHISAATNTALDIAKGDYVALLDHDDELPAHALYMIAASLNKNPHIDLIYSDEDKIDENGRRYNPYFKPDWNPDLFCAQNLISHLGIYRTEIVRSIGGFREGVEGSQDWDLAFRVVERVPSSNIQHIPHVLYHWRAVAGSTAIRHEEKSYVVSASQRVVSEHFQRTNQSVLVLPTFSSFVRAHYSLPEPTPRVSIILFGYSTNSEDLIRSTAYSEFEVILCLQSGDNALAEEINRSAKQATGDLLCFLDARLLPDADDWLEELVRLASRPEIGAVGPMQLNAEGNIQEAMTILCSTSEKNQVCRSYYQGMHHQEKGVDGRAALPQNVTVLASGCLVLNADAFWMLNGFDAKAFPSFLFELDLCLRLIKSGYRNMWTPYSRLVSSSDMNPYIHNDDINEVERFRMEWRYYIDHDPAHNPNLDCNSEWPFPAFPPRVDYPWRK